MHNKIYYIYNENGMKYFLAYFISKIRLKDFVKFLSFNIT